MHFCAKRFSNLTMEYDDIASIARIGLVKAAKTYDPKQGKFSTIAIKCMNTELLHEIDSASRKNDAAKPFHWMHFFRDRTIIGTVCLKMVRILRDSAMINCTLRNCCHDCETARWIS